MKIDRFNQSDRTRCDWALTDPVCISYHDREWGVPVHDDRVHFEFIVLDGFQAGLSWATILRKRERFRAVFDGLDPVQVAGYGEEKIQLLMQDAGIIRNRLKIEAAVRNARAFLNIQESFGSFDAYIWRFVGGTTRINAWRKTEDIPVKTPEAETMSRDLKQRGFSFAGPTICYATMQAAGLVNDHLMRCFRYEEIVKIIESQQAGNRPS
ncbi:MAG TPA: DNA-3-methyladenine glycosylase I [bacterium]|nr:DNA-3-methyladenine glycosylase I [bacterium]